MKIKVFAAFLFASASSLAQVQKINLEKDLSGQVVNLYEKKPGQKLSSLAQLKDHELQLKWNACLKLAPQVFSSEKDLQGWIALTWLHCLEEGQKKAKSDSQVRQVLARIEKAHLFEEGLWAENLWSQWLNLKLQQLTGQVSRKDFKAAAELDKILERDLPLNSEQKSLVYQLLGDLALQKNQYGEAKFLYEVAESQKNSPYIKSKLAFIAKAQNKVAIEMPPAEGAVEVPTEELLIEERISQAVKVSDFVPAMQDTIALLNQYPGSKSANRLKDKPLDIYAAIKDKPAKDKALKEMMKADPTRLLSWAESRHRRSDYEAAGKLAEASLEKAPSSPNSTLALWLLARSAHFLGDYEKALKSYSELIEKHNGSEEAAEAYFRASLIHYRKKNYSNAAALLERLLQQKREKYDLSARYWLVRSLEKVNPVRAQSEAAIVANEYPFSYYGLRLRAESQKGKLTWPTYEEKAPSLASEIWLTGSQKKSWKRFKKLSDAGWVGEAQIESGLFPYIKDAGTKIKLAEKLAERQQYRLAISLVNQAFDGDANLRRAQFLKISFPEIFMRLYRSEAERYKMDAVLLKSLTRQESAFNLRAVSRSQAMGLMQMIPPTAAEIAKKLGLTVTLPDDMFRPEINIPMGSFYVAQMLDQFKGNIPFALAGYNAGPYRFKGWVEHRPELIKALESPSSAPEDEIWFDELPWGETSFYVKAILRNMLLYRLIEEESYTLSPVLWQVVHNKSVQ